MADKEQARRPWEREEGSLVITPALARYTARHLPVYGNVQTLRLNLVNQAPAEDMRALIHATTGFLQYARDMHGGEMDQVVEGLLHTVQRPLYGPNRTLELLLSGVVRPEGYPHIDARVRLMQRGARPLHYGEQLGSAAWNALLLRGIEDPAAGRYGSYENRMGIGFPDRTSPAAAATGLVLLRWLDHITISQASTEHERLLLLQQRFKIPDHYDGTATYQHLVDTVSSQL